MCTMNLNSMMEALELEIFEFLVPNESKSNNFIITNSSYSCDTFRINLELTEDFRSIHFVFSMDNNTEESFSTRRNFKWLKNRFGSTVFNMTINE